MNFLGRNKPTKPSFDSLVDAEIPVLYRVALRLTRNEADAEDLVGQTLLAAARAWENFNGEFPRSWLIKILRNENLMVIRKRGSRPETQLEEVGEPSTEGYWQEIDWNIIGKDIFVELDRLPEDFRIAITLCDIEEMTREEAARALDIPVGTLGTRLHRGRNLLRSRLVKVLGDLTPA